MSDDVLTLEQKVDLCHDYLRIWKSFADLNIAPTKEQIETMRKIHEAVGWSRFSGDDPNDILNELAGGALFCNRYVELFHMTRGWCVTKDCPLYPSS